MDRLSGYLHPHYAHAFREFGEPRELPGCGGWILERPIPGTSHKDAMGCYPFFTCRDWFKLHEDLEKIESGLVSLALVTDPFGIFDQAYLAECFQIFKPFKKHLIADLSQELDRFVSKHHRYYAKRSLRNVQVEVCEEPTRYIDDWVRLYGTLVDRHNISGIRAFSKDSFVAQMQTPGVELLIGKVDGEVVGGHMIVIHGNLAYAHLAAFSDIGYQYGAAYGIYWVTMAYLAEKNIRFLDLGASAGLDDSVQDGLSRFKSGWSNNNRTVYFCGKILEDGKYKAVCRQKNVGTTQYFPAYRKGEFD